MRGRILADDGHPLANEQVDLVLPETYGLTASEARNPARFGNSTRIGSATSNSKGEFSHSFGFAVYHVDFFSIPYPIRIPDKPPGLFFFMRVPRVASEYYGIHAREESFRVFSEEGTEVREGALGVLLTVREEMHRGDGPVQLSTIVELRYGARGSSSGEGPISS
ncbi:MAG: hypothetical protein ACRD3V_01235 [Vicinamibacteria bacterium]